MHSKRDVGPLLQMIRDFLLRRKNVNSLRFTDTISQRTQPPPNLPLGPHAKLADNYYCSRDARRLVKPNQVIAEGSTLLKLPEGGEKPVKVLQRVPGKIYNWDM